MEEIEQNNKGQLLVDIEEFAKSNLYVDEYREGFSRYNGGWIKSVTGIDKSHTDGYSVLGNFAWKGKQWYYPGIYLDCSISGSRKAWQYRYHLFVLRKDGSFKSIADEVRSISWAVDLWKPIEKALSDPSLLETEQSSRLQILKEQEIELLEQLKKIREEIGELEAQ